MSGPPSSAGRNGLLRVVGNDELHQQGVEEAAATAATRQGGETATPTDLASYIRGLWTIFRNHRNTGDGSGNLNERLLRAQRMFEGKYDPAKLAEIRKFGGSQVYSRLVAVKCRGATSLLRDVYLGPDRPWDIEPENDPPIPPDVTANVLQLVAVEVQTQQQAGTQVGDSQVHARIMGLMHAAQQAARRKADSQAAGASEKVDDMLVQGKFYDALAAFLIDLPLFPFACMKGPVVRMVPMLVWGPDGSPSMQTKPQMFWERVSPFNLYWSPGASTIADADVLERHRLTRTDLNDLLGLPGYDQKAIRAVLDDYSRGLRDWLDAPDTEQALNEGRENPTMNQSGVIDALEFHGQIQGHKLLLEGMDPAMIPDPDRDYAVQSWVIGRHTIKTQLNPSPRLRHPYFITSFEKVPGTVSGHGLPDLLEDIQEVCNATLRALVNNLGFASGPQVVVNDDALAPTENGDEMYPWKRWHVVTDPMDPGQNKPPISFFQPASNAQELLSVYTAMSKLADEISAIPSYITGSSQSMGGAGRTASGLSMLMGNAEKILQTVAANIDNDVMDPLLSALYDMVVLTDQSRMLTGDETIRVRGVNVAVQKETERAKQLQFLQITANPIDAPIIGEIGRARVLRALAASLGLPDDVVPDDETLQAQIDAQKQMQAVSAQLQAQLPPDQQAAGPGGKPGSTPGKPAPTPGNQAQGNQAPNAPPLQHSDNAPPVNLQQQGLPTNG